MYNEMTYFNGVAETVPTPQAAIDKWGGPETFPHMAAGSAVAGDAPFIWTKQVASDFGGTRNPFVITGRRVFRRRATRSQFSHVTDIAPTMLEATGLPEPKTVNGEADAHRRSEPLYTFNDAKAASATRPSTSKCSATAPSQPWLGRAHCTPRTVGSQAGANSPMSGTFTT